MRLQVIVSFGILQTILYASPAASLVERQAGPMITATPPVLTPAPSDKPLSTSMPGGGLVPPQDLSSPVVHVSVPEPPNDVHPIPPDTNNPTATPPFDNRQGEASPPNNTNNITKTSDSSGTNNSTSGKQNNTGIIIGGIAAGLVILALIFGVILYRHRRSQRQVNEIKGYMGSGKRSSEGSDFEVPPAAAHRPTSPPSSNQEYTHLMEGYSVQQQQQQHHHHHHHPPGSRGSIFREGMNTAGPTPLPPTMQYHHEDDDHPGDLHGPSSRRPLRRDQDLVRTESIISTTDVDIPVVERSAPCVPRLPIYCTRPSGTAL